MNFLLKFSKTDLFAAKTMMNAGSTDELCLNIAAYHIQQAYEKLLKGYLEINGEKSPFTHDISKLLDMCSKLGLQTTNEILLSAGTLTSWEAGARYRSSFFVNVKQLKLTISNFETLFNQIINGLTIEEKEIIESENVSDTETIN